MSNRIVKLPSVESFGHLTPDKWLLLKTLEEAAEMVEAGKRLVKGDSTARRDLMAKWADVLQTLVNVATAFDITDGELAQAHGRLPRSQSGTRPTMSIISSDAKWAVLRRAVRLSPEEIRGTTKGKEYEAGFIAGATRQPTDEEIAAGAKAFYEALKPDSYPQWDSDCALRAEYYDAMRLAVKAMQGKATEE